MQNVINWRKWLRITLKYFSTYYWQQTRLSSHLVSTSFKQKRQPPRLVWSIMFSHFFLGATTSVTPPPLCLRACHGYVNVGRVTVKRGLVLTLQLGDVINLEIRRHLYDDVCERGAVSRGLWCEAGLTATVAVVMRVHAPVVVDTSAADLLPHLCQFNVARLRLWPLFYDLWPHSVQTVESYVLTY